MSYISGARSVPDEQVRIASTKMEGIGPKKAMKFRYRLGISGNIKIRELTKYQIDQISNLISQDHVVHWELKRFELGQLSDIERKKANFLVIVEFVIKMDRPYAVKRTHTKNPSACYSPPPRSTSSQYNRIYIA